MLFVISCKRTAFLNSKETDECGHSHMDIYKSHVIEIDPLGELSERRIGAVIPDTKKRAVYSKTEHFQDILKGIDEHLRNGNRKILLFAHGGLNSPNASFERAIKNTCDIKRDAIYPVFINWHSGPFSSYGQQLMRVRRGVEYRRFFNVFFPVFFFSDVIEGVGRSLESSTNNWLSNFNTLTDYESKGPRLLRTRPNCKAIQSVLEKRMLESPSNSIQSEIGPDSRSRHGRMLRGTWMIAVTGTRIVGTPLWDGLGTPAWVNMKRRAHALIYPPSVFDIRDIRSDEPEVERNLDGGKQGVVADFIVELIKLLKNHQDKDYEITLMGHSMGAIVANDILLYFPDLNVTNIVHMAAASSVVDCANSVYPYMMKQKSTRFYNLTLHPISENREHMVSKTELFLPRGSLLSHIDCMFEETASFSDRTSGRWENYIQCTQMIPEDIRQRVTIKAFEATSAQRPSPKGVQYDDSNYYFKPQNHGQFDDGRYWSESFWRVR